MNRMKNNKVYKERNVNNTNMLPGDPAMGCRMSPFLQGGLYNGRYFNLS